MIKQYFYLQFKNCIEIIKKNLICLLCIITVMTVALAAVNFVMGQNIDNSFIKVGIVTDEDNSEIKALMRYISHEGSIEKIASFEYLSREEAFDELNSSNLNIVIDIPKDYYNNIDTGINTPLDIYVNNNTDVFTMAFVRILYSAETYIRNSEATVYSVLDTYHSGDYILKSNINRLGDYVALIYADIIIHRLNIYDNRIINSFGEISPIQHFYLVFIFLITIFVVNLFNDLYSKDNYQFERLIKVYGINGYIQSLTKQIAICSFTIPIIFVFHLIAAGIINKNFSSIHFGIKFYISAIVFILSVVALYNMLSFILINTKYKELMIFIIFFIMLLLSGCIIPSGFLPDIINVLSKILPFEYTRNAIISGIKDSFNSISLIICLIYIIIENIMVTKCSRH